MVCKMLLSISYTVEHAENQLFIAVLCKMQEMCVITKYRLFDKTPMRHFAIGSYAGPRLLYTKTEGSYVVDGHVVNIACPQK